MFSPFMCLNRASRRICSIIFPETTARLTFLEMPRSSFLHSWKMGAMFAVFPAHLESPNHNDLSKMSKRIAL